MSGKGKYENFEHTADLGLYIHGRNPRELFETACEALCAQLTDPATVRPAERRELELAADGYEELLRLWLAELLYQYNGMGWLPRTAKIIRLERDGLRAIVSGEPADLSRHQIVAEIKAVTWHRLGIETNGEGMLRATVVFDV